MRGKPHVIYVWKENLASAYFDSLRVRRDMISIAEAANLLDNMGYIISVNGFPCIVLAVQTLLVVVGAGNRVEKPQTVAERSVASCTLGHEALVSSFIRVNLEVKAGLRNANGGVREGIYSVWVEELVRVDQIFPTDTLVHDGLRLVDRDDPQRSILLRAGDNEEEVLGEEDGGGGGANGDEDED